MLVVHTLIHMKLSRFCGVDIRPFPSISTISVGWVLWIVGAQVVIIRIYVLPKIALETFLPDVCFRVAIRSDVPLMNEPCARLRCPPIHGPWSYSPVGEGQALFQALPQSCGSDRDREGCQPQS